MLEMLSHRCTIVKKVGSVRIRSATLSRTYSRPTRSAVHHRWNRSRKIVLAVSVFFFITIISSVAFTSYQTLRASYLHDMSLADDGIQRLRMVETVFTTLAQHPLQADTLVKAQQQFRLAHSDFAQLQTDLQALPPGSTHIPVYGGELRAALYLVPAALHMTDAGEIACSLATLLMSRLQNPLNSKGSGITAHDLALIEQDMQHITTILSSALDLVSQIQPGDVQFNPRLAKLVQAAQAAMPTLRQWLSGINTVLPVLPVLSGIPAPTHYLIEVLDSTELRPGGGFIGNYGIATFIGGRLADTSITDVDLLDRPFEAKGHTIPFPAIYAWFPLSRDSWSFRDSNLEADFPTSARLGEQNFALEGGNLSLQGVIAITPAFIQQAFALTGPIYVPEYQQTVTAQNLVALIHYHQLGPAHGDDTIPSRDGHSSQRKRFTALLAEHFLARLHQLPTTAQGGLVQVLLNGLHTKDVQVYLNNSAAERLLQLAHVDGAIASPSGDSLLLVDANVSPNKANSFMHYTLDDWVTLDEQGNATHHTTLTYAWTIDGIDYGNARYRDYLRIYVPPGSSLLQHTGLEAMSTGSAFDRSVWGGLFYLYHGQTHTITLVWSVPHAAHKDAHGWHYQYEIQKQAGILWQLHMQVSLAVQRAFTTMQGGLMQSNGHALLASPLYEDMHMEVGYR